MTYFSYASSKLFWLKELIAHRGIGVRWREALKIEAGTLDDVSYLRDGKLLLLLQHAIRTVPYYQKWFASHSVDVANVKIDDFPIISKSDIRNHEEDFISSTVPVEGWARTSGSTGEPFRFGKTSEENVYTYADLWRGMWRFGIRAGDKRVLVKGVDETPHLTVFGRFLRFVYGVINRCIVVDAHFLARSEMNVEHELKRIIAYRPCYLHGYASSIYLLARYAEDHGIDCSGLNLKAIVTESEKCHDFQRELMERVFNTTVVENYGCVEFGMIAQPAKDGQLCINEDHVFVEATEEGEAVYTNLDEYGFPLIRFKNGDMIKIGNPHSELPYRTIAELDGRKTEMIKLPQGGALHGFIPMYPVSKHSKWMMAYQIYQPKIDQLIIRIIPQPQVVFPNEIRLQIVEEMREIVGDIMSIEFEFLDSIPLSKRGKRVFVCSDVK